MSLIMPFCLYSMENETESACQALLTLQKSVKHEIPSYLTQQIKGAACYTVTKKTKTYTRYTKLDNLQNNLPTSFFLCHTCKKMCYSLKKIEAHCYSCKTPN